MNVCMVVYNLVNNGIGKVVLTYSAELVKHGHAVTVLVGGPSDKKKTEQAAELGISVCGLPDKKKNTAAYFSALKNALDAGAYDIVHIHGNSGMVLPELIVAKSSRVVAVACHCHNTGCEHPVLHELFRPFIPRLSDCNLACSEEAGRWLFKKSDFTVLPNSFDLGTFAFDPAAREMIRDAYGIDERAFVLGNVARLNPAKNHAFLIEVFERFRRRNRNSRLMIVGGGPGEGDVGKMVADSPERDAILMLGDVDDPAKLYSAMDCFVFPSIHEGLGIVLIEAQLSGLDCFVSDAVPEAACVTDRFYSIPLSAGADAWAESIGALSAGSANRTADVASDPRARAFDIEASYGILEEAYKRTLAGGRE